MRYHTDRRRAPVPLSPAEKARAGVSLTVDQKRISYALAAVRDGVSTAEAVAAYVVAGAAVECTAEHATEALLHLLQRGKVARGTSAGGAETWSAA